MLSYLFKTINVIIVIVNISYFVGMSFLIYCDLLMSLFPNDGDFFSRKWEIGHDEDSLERTKMRQ